MVGACPFLDYDALASFWHVSSMLCRVCVAGYLATRVPAYPDMWCTTYAIMVHHVRDNSDRPLEGVSRRRNGMTGDGSREVLNQCQVTEENLAVLDALEARHMEAIFHEDTEKEWKQ